MATTPGTQKVLERTVVVGPFQCNCRIYVCPITGDAALIDPGAEPERLLAELERMETQLGKPLRVRALIHTHGHLDHIGATRGVKRSLIPPPGLRGLGAARGVASHGARGQESFLGREEEWKESVEDSSGPKIWLHRGDEPLYRELRKQGALFGLQFDDPLPVDSYLEDGQELHVGSLKISVLHTPGHSPGSVCLRVHEDSQLGVCESVLSGDTLFQGSVGRTDLWGANSDQMFESIRRRLLTLDDDTRVHPGHGPSTRIGIERRSNPFL